MPILKIARRMVLLAVELPEPFLVPTMIEKSLITLFMMLLNFLESISLPMDLRSGLRDSRYITVCDTKGPCERRAPHSPPDSLHCKSIPPSFDDNARLLVNNHSHRRR